MYIFATFAGLVLACSDDFTVFLLSHLGLIDYNCCTGVFFNKIFVRFNGVFGAKKVGVFS